MCRSDFYRCRCRRRRSRRRRIKFHILFTLHSSFCSFPSHTSIHVASLNLFLFVLACIFSLMSFIASRMGSSLAAHLSISVVDLCVLSVHSSGETSEKHTKSYSNCIQRTGTHTPNHSVAIRWRLNHFNCCFLHANILYSNWLLYLLLLVSSARTPNHGLLFILHSPSGIRIRRSLVAHTRFMRLKRIPLICCDMRPMYFGFDCERDFVLCHAIRFDASSTVNRWAQLDTLKWFTKLRTLTRAEAAKNVCRPTDSICFTSNL